MNPYEHNREAWNELTELHMNSEFYNVEAFRNGETSLNPIELNELGDVKAKKLLHLQCHFGMDTLSFARMGAKVTGVDISDTSIEQAQNMAKDLALEAIFISSNVYDLKELLQEQFDIVYTSYGAINWLEDLDAWAETVKHFLKPGGVFYMVEFHPYSYSLGEDLQIKYPYFKSEAMESIVEASYTDNSEVKKKDLKHIEWHHSLSEVINALIGQALEIEFLNEFPYQVYNCFPGMVEIEKGKWVYESLGDKIPYMYSIRAIRK